MLFQIHYQRYGDCKRIKRGSGGDGRPARFTGEEAIEFLARNRHRYPRAWLKPALKKLSSRPRVEIVRQRMLDAREER